MSESKLKVYYNVNFPWKIQINDREKNKFHKYDNNYISTSKYELWNFFPKAITY